MAWFRSSFEWAGDLYSRVFADWLHINFIIRTIILLLMLWLIIFVAGLVFKFVLGPLAVLIYVNVIKRAWNFLVTETLHEWLYIKYYSQGSPRFANWYLRLCDRVKHNRTILSNSGFSGIFHRGRVRVMGTRMMIVATVIATMWVVAFGLNQEYAAPAWVGVDVTTNTNNEDDNVITDTDDYPEPDNTEDEYESDIYNDNDDINEFISPGQFPLGSQVALVLAEHVQEEGARLWDMPSLSEGTVVEMLWGDEPLTFLGYYVADSDVDALYWLRVRAPSRAEGYIGSQLVEVAE